MNGFLVSVRDAASLARALRKLLADPELRIRLGRNSRDLVLSRFTLEHVLNSNIAVFDSLLSPSGSKPVREAELINLLRAVSPADASEDCGWPSPTKIDIDQTSGVRG